MRLLLGSFLNMPDQESPYRWKLLKGNPHWAEQPGCPRSRGRSSKQKARPVGNKKELPNFNKAGVKGSAAEQKSCQEDVHHLARGNSKRKVRFGFFFFHLRGLFWPAKCTSGDITSHIPGHPLPSQQTALGATTLKLRCYNASERFLSFHSIKNEMIVSEVGSLGAPV